MFHTELWRGEHRVGIVQWTHIQQYRTAVLGSLTTPTGRDEDPSFHTGLPPLTPTPTESRRMLQAQRTERRRDPRDDVVRPFHVAAALMFALAACGSGAPAPSALPPADPNPIAGFGACGERWVSSPDEPRIGMYLFERYAGDEDETSAFMNLLAYDGESVILRWLSNHSVGETCVYGSLDAAPRGVLRMRAAVRGDGQIYALQPCHGWLWVGRFVEGDRIETTYPDYPPYLLRRLPRRELEGELRAELDAIDFFACRDVYEAEGAPVPPLPE